MPIDSIIGENQPALFALGGAILGFIANQITAWISKYIDHRYQVKIKHLDLCIELERKYLLEPVVHFIENDLKSMQTIYSHIFRFDNADSRLVIDNEYVFEMTSIEARLKGLGDEVLSERFTEFSRLKISIGNAVTDGKTEDAFQKLNEAIQLAGKIIELLFKRMRQVEN